MKHAFISFLACVLLTLTNFNTLLVRADFVLPGPREFEPPPKLPDEENVASKVRPYKALTTTVISTTTPYVAYAEPTTVETPPQEKLDLMQRVRHWIKLLIGV